jgi:D-glycero-alpha-D-manno-heptose 1-phosphate guanylyltransferase
MQAIVLAGGLGTRLRGVVPELPKPMAPVRGRPFLAFILDRLVDAGFETTVLAVGYRYEAIRSHFGERYRGLTLRYSVESEPLGTGGAIWLAWALAAKREVFVLNGDTYLELDYRAMLDVHRSGDAQISMAVSYVHEAGRYGALDLADGRVSGFLEKGQLGPGWINAGVYILASALVDRFPWRGAFSFERDLLVPEVKTIRPLAFPTHGLFIDIGIPEDYARAQTLLPAIQA